MWGHAPLGWRTLDARRENDVGVRCIPDAAAGISPCPGRPDRGHGPRRSGGRDPRRAGRSDQPGPDHESPLDDDGQLRPVSNHQPACWHLFGHLHARGVLQAAAEQRRADHRIHRSSQCHDDRRPARGYRHGDWRIADRRRAERASGLDVCGRGHSRSADDAQHPQHPDADAGAHPDRSGRGLRGRRRRLVQQQHLQPGRARRHPTNRRSSPPRTRSPTTRSTRAASWWMGRSSTPGAAPGSWG